MDPSRKSGSAPGATSRPPRTFRFLHLTGTIEPADGEHLDNLGEWDIRTATVRYDSTSTHDVQRETILHEMLHVILEHTDVEHEQHENLIRAVSPLLLHLLTVNPRLVQFLIKG